MATLKFYSYFEVTINGRQMHGGSLSTPASITVGDDYEVLRQEIATTTTWDVWAAGSERLGSFSFAWIVSDRDVYLELTVDKDGDNGVEVLAFTIEAGVPFALANDTGLANYTVDFAALTADVIDQIRIHNPDATNAAKVEVLLFE